MVSPIINNGILKVLPIISTNVTIRNEKRPIQAIDKKKERKQYLPIPGLRTSGIVIAIA